MDGSGQVTYDRRYLPVELLNKVGLGLLLVGFDIVVVEQVVLFSCQSAGLVSSSAVDVPLYCAHVMANDSDWKTCIVEHFTLFSAALANRQVAMQSSQYKKDLGLSHAFWIMRVSGRRLPWFVGVYPAAQR